MTTIHDLVRLVPPPSEPKDARGDWTSVEEAVGVRLPADFKALIGRYGEGEFVDLITLLTPFGERQPLIEHARLLLADEAPFRDEFPDDCPYPFFPEPGGLLVWATTSNGDRLCWLTDGDPAAWRVVAWNPRSVIYERHEMDAVEFLHGWLSGSLWGRLAEPDETVGAVAFLASADASYITGATLLVDGGYTIVWATAWPSGPQRHIEDRNWPL